MKDNKLIAEFMGANPTKESTNVYAYEMYGIIDTIEDGVNEQHFFLSSEMKFHSSWDWLMPVVDKIESFEDDNRCCKYNVKIEQCWTEIIDNKTSDRIVLVDADDKKLSTFKAIVVFIKRIKKGT